ncbi:HIT family protein [Hymenobacter jeollabukensis]|uniref:HIT domain-containing protein n=1 Tax=Hymenobacter jeollabukensis TaxID=2025313 RepID=A0A5R8WK00_9BACT|nr:HIT domain-containing protein [Hymenobacter jeollabukensis]TLM89359.1 HIT domain-containing protein [Hymenobacter jeollabukensis]
MSNPANPNSHLTAKERDAPSLPVRMLHGRGLLVGRVLDYGCGYGRDIEFLRAKGFDAQGYDPTYFPEKPTRKFDTILCFYVLNVLLADEQAAVLMDIARLLKPTGRAYFAVRRDITQDGLRQHYLHKKPVYQCAVTLPFPSIFRNDNTEFYEYQHYTQATHSASKCPFCSPSPKLHLLTETTRSYAVLDGYPVSKGHALILPKAHVANFFDLSLAEQNDCWLLAGHAQRMISNRYAPAGFTVGLNIGAASGQRMEHASIHVIPRYVGDVKNPAGGIRNILKR